MTFLTETPCPRYEYRVEMIHQQYRDVTKNIVREFGRIFCFSISFGQTSLLTNVVTVLQSFDNTQVCDVKIKMLSQKFCNVNPLKANGNLSSFKL